MSDTAFDDPRLDLIEERSGPAVAADCCLVLVGIKLYCARQLGQAGALPDGVIGAVQLRKLRHVATSPEACAELLADAGLLERLDPVRFRVAGWDEEQPSSEEVRQRREAWTVKKRQQRASRRVSPKVSPGDSPGDSRGDSPGESRSPGPGPGPVPDPDPDPDDERARASSIDGEEPSEVAFEPLSHRHGSPESVIWLEWRKAFLGARGIDPADEALPKREVARVLSLEAERRGVALEELAGDVARRYFADPWARNVKNRASLRNLVSRLPSILEARLADAGEGVAVDGERDPADYDPAKHGAPKESRNFRAWNRYLDRLEDGGEARASTRSPALEAEAPSPEARATATALVAALRTVPGAVERSGNVIPMVRR